VENPTRRRVLAAGVTGTALGLLGSRAASASPDQTPTTPTTEAGGPTTAATTTTLPPQAPQPGDVPLLNFAEGVELAARDLYQEAVTAGIKDDVLTGLLNNHRGFGDIIRGRLGTRSDGVRDEDLYRQYTDQFKVTDMKALATPAYELESTLVATHTAIIGRLQGTDGARLLASIQIVEGRQAAVLAEIGGHGDDFDVLFDDSAEPLPLPAIGS
jgi:hypothetical protein